MHRSIVHASVLVALRLTPTAGAQIPVPPRDRRLAAPSSDARGTAVITGRVVDGVTGTPLARARVRLNSSIGEPVLVMTDTVVTFRFTRLPPGEYSVTAEKSTSARVTVGGDTLADDSKRRVSLRLVK